MLAGLVYIGAVFLIAGPIFLYLIIPLGINESQVGWIVLVLLLCYSLVQGAIQINVIDQGWQKDLLWIIGYLLSVLAGVIGVLHSFELFLDFDNALFFAATLGPGLGIGTTQALLLRKKFRFPYLLIAGSIASVYLGLLTSETLKNTSFLYNLGDIPAMLFDITIIGTAYCLPSALVFHLLPEKISTPEIRSRETVYDQNSS